MPIFMPCILFGKLMAVYTLSFVRVLVLVLSAQRFFIAMMPQQLASSANSSSTCVYVRVFFCEFVPTFAVGLLCSCVHVSSDSRLSRAAIGPPRSSSGFEVQRCLFP